MEVSFSLCCLASAHLMGSWNQERKMLLSYETDLCTGLQDVESKEVGSAFIFFIAPVSGPLPSPREEGQRVESLKAESAR